MITLVMSEAKAELAKIGLNKRIKPRVDFLIRRMLVKLFSCMPNGSISEHFKILALGHLYTTRVCDFTSFLIEPTM